MGKTFLRPFVFSFVIILVVFFIGIATWIFIISDYKSISVFYDAPVLGVEAVILIGIPLFIGFLKMRKEIKINFSNPEEFIAKFEKAVNLIDFYKIKEKNNECIYKYKPSVLHELYSFQWGVPKVKVFIAQDSITISLHPMLNNKFQKVIDLIYA